VAFWPGIGRAVVGKMDGLFENIGAEATGTPTVSVNEQFASKAKQC
jgi:hypothetical protein